MKGNSTNNISEHLPLTLVNNIEFMCLLFVYIALLMFTDTKIRARYAFLLGGMLLLSFQSRRQVSLCILLGSYVLIGLICNFINKYSKDLPQKAEKYMVSILGRVTTIAIVLILSMLLFKDKVGNTYINDKTYPVAAAEYINNNLDKETMRIYNEYNYGSYLLYKDIPVFVDSRADLYTPEFNGGKDIFKDFLNISNIGVYYEDKFKEYDFTHVIVYKSAKLRMLISRDPNYEELYIDNNFAIYKRNTPKEEVTEDNVVENNV